MRLPGHAKGARSRQDSELCRTGPRPTTDVTTTKWNCTLCRRIGKDASTFIIMLIVKCQILKCLFT